MSAIITAVVLHHFYESAGRKGPEHHTSLLFCLISQSDRFPPRADKAAKPLVWMYARTDLEMPHSSGVVWTLWTVTVKISVQCGTACAGTAAC